MHQYHHDIPGTDGTLAHLTGYLIENSPEIDADRTRPAVIVVPGGGYEFTSDREADPIALSLLGQGYDAFVLRYSVKPAVYPAALLELARSVTIIRHRAHEWHINPDAIVIAGFSASGHLCACLGTGTGDAELKDHGVDVDLAHPNGMMLGYPVITSGQYGHHDSFKALLGEQYANQALVKHLSLERNVTHDTSRTFIWHTVTDDLVPVQNSLLFVQACVEQGVPVEAHIYPHGGHGLSLGTTRTSWHGVGAVEPCVQSWMGLFTAWLGRSFPNR